MSALKEAICPVSLVLSHTDGAQKPVCIVLTYNGILVVFKGFVFMPLMS